MSNKKAEISKNFEIVSRFTPTGDQPKAIKELTNNILLIKQKEQLLLGATGTGKTFTMSHIIANLNKPTLILAPNKTLAMQLFGEFKELFPNNKVEYFVSFFDYYRPEAYIAKSNTYINKLTQHNKELRMLRLSTVNALLTRKDVIVVASVAAIYGAFNPALYKSSFLYIETNNKDMN